MKNDPLKDCLHCFVARYLFVFSVAVILLCTLFIKDFQVVGSKAFVHLNQSFDSGLDPEFYIHASDIHISYKNEDTQKDLKRVLNISSLLGTNHMVIGGDLVQNWKKSMFWHSGSQNLEEFKIYWNIINSSGIEVYDIAGNHDEVSLDSFNSSSHYYREYSHSGPFESENSFSIISKEFGDVSLILVNPFDFPTLPALLNYWIYPTKDFLNRLDEVLTKSANPVILVSHYPIKLWDTEMSRYPNVKLIVSGHLHPYKPRLYFHKNTLEIVAPDVKTHKMYSVVTSDNGALSFTSFKLTDIPKALLTYPVPLDQTTQYTVFDSEAIHIRSIVFDDTVTSIPFSGDVSGNMTLSRVLNSKSRLFEATVHGNKQVNKIKIGYPIDKTLKFVHGQEITRRVYTAYHFTGLLRSQMLITIFFLVVFAVAIFFSFIPHNLKDTFEREDFGSKIIDVFYAPAYYGYQMKRNFKKLRLYFCLLVLIPFFIPSLIVGKGTKGFLFPYGYFDRNRYYYSRMGSIFLTVYYVLTLYPFLMLLTSKREFIMFDWMLAGIGNIITFALLFTLFSEPSGAKLNFFNPLFVIIPVLNYTIILLLRSSFYEEEEDEVPLVNVSLK